MITITCQTSLMKALNLLAIAGAALTSVFVTSLAQARMHIPSADRSDGEPRPAISGTLQCVPFARETSGIRLYGDAHTWWSQAQGKYSRGTKPRVGAVMAIDPHAGSTLGHVATVSAIKDSRTILITHANWSAPGKIERNVTAVDTSPANDWSAVRLWYAPIAGLGTTHWPVAGFIYNSAPNTSQRASTEAKPDQSTLRPTLTAVPTTKTAKVRFGVQSDLIRGPDMPSPTTRFAGKARATTKSTASQAVKRSARKDPIGAIISRTY